MFSPWLYKKINYFWWKSIWKKRQIQFHRDEASPNLNNYFHYLQLPAGAHVFVPLCGKTKDMQWLAAHNFRVTGVELSPIACREFFAEMNVEPCVTKHKNFHSYRYNNLELLCGDFFKLTPESLTNIDAIYDCRALIALPAEIRRQYVQKLIECTNSHVKILLIGFDSSSKVPGPPFSITSSEISSLFSPKFKIQVLSQKSVEPIPQHLVDRGFQEMIESIYFLYPSSNWLN